MAWLRRVVLPDRSESDPVVLRGLLGGRPARFRVRFRLAILAVAIVSIVLIFHLGESTSGGSFIPASGHCVRQSGPGEAAIMSTAPPGSSDPFQAFGQALSAWEAFSMSGNAELLWTSFDTRGPQYRAMASQAAFIEGGCASASSFRTVGSPTIAEHGGSVTIRASLTTGGHSDTLPWVVTLRESSNMDWFVWSIEVQ